VHEKGKALLKAVEAATPYLNSAVDNIFKALECLAAEVPEDALQMEHIGLRLGGLGPDTCWEATGTKEKLSDGTIGVEYLWAHPDKLWDTDYQPRWLIVGDEMFQWNVVMDIVFTKLHKYYMVGDDNKMLLVAPFPSKEGDSLVTRCLVVDELPDTITAEDLRIMVYGNDDDNLPD